LKVLFASPVKAVALPETFVVSTIAIASTFMPAPFITAMMEAAVDHFREKVASDPDSSPTKLQEILDQNTGDVYERDPYGMAGLQHVPVTTALYFCVQGGNEEAVRMLLEAGARPDAGQNWTPLCVAAVRGYNTIVNMLLAAGANVHGKGKTSILSIMMKEYGGRVFWDVVDSLLSAGAIVTEDVIENAMVVDGGEEHVHILLEHHRWAGIRSIFSGAVARSQLMKREMEATTFDQKRLKKD
jgi:hypothetical protein